MANITDKQLAKQIGVSEQTLAKYRDRGCKAKTVAGIRKWREKHIGDNGPPTIGERERGERPRRKIAADKLEEEELRAKIRKLDAEAEARELKNAQVRGELYEAADIERQVAELTSLIRCRLEAIPDELQTEWPLELRPLVTQRMADKLHLILTEMSQWRLTVTANVPASDHELPTAAEDTADSVEPGEHPHA